MPRRDPCPPLTFRLCCGFRGPAGLKKELEALKNENKALRDALTSTRSSIGSAPEFYVRSGSPSQQLRHSFAAEARSNGPSPKKPKGASARNLRNGPAPKAAKGAKGAVGAPLANWGSLSGPDGPQCPPPYPGAYSGGWKGGDFDGGKALQLPNITTSGRSREEIAAQEKVRF